MKWTLEGDQFSAKGGGAELSGTLAGGVLNIKNMMDMGLDVRLVCPELYVPTEDPEQAAAAETGENVLMNGTQIFFQNTLDVALNGLYISNTDEWGDRVNEDAIAAGDAFILDISKLSDGPGTYDVGAIDENGRNYDVYEVPLDGKRLVGISSEGDEAYIVLIDENGETETFTGKAYDSEE